MHIVDAALVGLSGYGSTYFRALTDPTRTPGVRIVAAVVRNRSRCEPSCSMLESTGGAVFGSIDEFVSSGRRVDLCILPTAPQDHAAQACQLMQAGMDVLIEKPVATTEADARKVEAAAVVSNRVAAVGFQHLYVPATHGIRERIVSGEIGKVQYATVIGCWPRPVSYFKRNDWAGRRTVNGKPVLDSAVSNAFSHVINLALFWAGTPENPARIRSIRGAVHAVQDIETFDTARLSLGLSSGVDIDVHVTHSGESFVPATIVIQCTNGRIVWTQDAGCLVVAQNAAPIRLGFPSVEECRGAMLHSVAERCRGNDAFVCSPEMAIEPVRLMEMLDRQLSPTPVEPGNVRLLTRGGEQYRFIAGLSEELQSLAHHARLVAGGRARRPDNGITNTA